MEDKKERENTPEWVIILREAVKEAIEEKKREKKHRNNRIGDERYIRDQDFDRLSSIADIHLDR